MSSEQAVSNYLLEIADDHLVLGHRLSEWCGHAPTLEEDIALANIALDCLGIAQFTLESSAELAGNNQTADDLAFFREQADFRNCLLVEQKNGDFAQTMLRQFFFDAYVCELFAALSESSNEQISSIATKALKEARYHLRHSSSWIIRLGDGTEESKNRTLAAVKRLWQYTDELFYTSETARQLIESGFITNPEDFKPAWQQKVKEVFAEAKLGDLPEEIVFQYGGRDGRHSEYLGHLLAEMQITARSHPGAQW